MFIKAATLDDLMRKVFQDLLDIDQSIKPSRGAAKERTGVLLQLTNPLARLSRTEIKGQLFSALGELLWYLAKGNSLAFIEYYVKKYAAETEDGETIYGAYGPRLFKKNGVDQVQNVIELLRKNSHSRRAVIQLFDAEDISRDRKEVPCTCTLQFMIRGKNKLDMLVSMRSNDAYYGLPHDVFAFTMIQELIARSLGVGIGTYKHFAASLHIYEKHFAYARSYLKEGWQEKVSMPPMPPGDQWEYVADLLVSESEIRLNGERRSKRLVDFPPYWSDLENLLRIYKCFKDERPAKIAAIKKNMSVRVYDPYIDKKKRKKKPSQISIPVQEPLFEPDELLS